MIHNVHTREIDADPETVGEALATLGGPDDRWWPAPAWAPLVLDRPMSVGADGGHGPIRYHVSAYEPGRRVRFKFDPACGLDGHHELTVTPSGEGARIEHQLRCTTRGRMRMLQPLLVKVHDAVLEDLLDNAEREATGTVRRSARWSPLVRVLRRAEQPRPRTVGVPDGATLARRTIDDYGGAGQVDLLDSYAVPFHSRLPADPQVWADAVFRSPPRWVVALLALRQAVVGLVGISRDDGTAFDTTARADDEALLGTDAGHLDFRASVHVTDDAVTLTTVARTNDWRGRLYLLPVGVLHPPIVRSMLARAHRQLVTDTVRAPGAPRGRAPR